MGVVEPPKLTEYLEKSGRISSAALDALRYEYSKRYYYYGDQFKRPFENPRHDRWIRVLIEFVRRARSAAKSLRTGSHVDIQSNAYFTVNRELEKLGYSVALPPWINGGPRLPPAAGKSLRSVDRVLRTGNFSHLYSKSFMELLEHFESSLRDYYRQLKALFVPFDMGYYENISLRIFRQLEKPSFVYLHGLPGRYNNIDDNRANHLIVWGEAIKRHYVHAGVDPARIIISGHPELSRRRMQVSRNGTEDVVVLTKSMSGAQSITGETIVSDRSDCVLYLYLVQDALRRRGVRRARYRPHPSENPDWYWEYIDREFYRPDTGPLEDSLAAATLVVGPTSTVFLNALASGVNYVVFEPVRNGLDILGYPVVAPFDGSDCRLAVAQDQRSLEELINERDVPARTIFEDYVGDHFDLSFVRAIVE